MKKFKDPKRNIELWGVSSSIRSGKDHKTTSKTSKKEVVLTRPKFPQPKPVYSIQWVNENRGDYYD